mmetsp:Transcript_51908/g.161052  ORF Transcript_51908/g.161052 Transcript_51908/m.161052 type:complete len:257 (-) Transcript_51908:39-809(-)
MAAVAKSFAVAAALFAPAGASHLRRGADACECVNWRQAYQGGGAKCGDGHEFYVATSSGVPRFMARVMLGIEFCEGFYKRINDNFCVNLDHDNKPGMWYGGQWCYVSGQCASASPSNGTGSLRVKLCKEGQDKQLRDKSPEEAIEWAKANDFETGLLLKMAYPVEKEVKWPAVKDAFLSPGAGSLSADAAGASSMERLSALTRSGKPVILDSADGHPPFAVVQGSTAHLLEMNREGLSVSHPNSVTSVKCVAGCGK